MERAVAVTCAEKPVQAARPVVVPYKVSSTIRAGCRATARSRLFANNHTSPKGTQALSIAQPLIRITYIASQKSALF